VSRVVVLVDEPIFELGLQSLIKDDPEFDLICVCRSVIETVHASELHQPDLVVLRLTPNADLNIALELQRVAPRAAVVLWGRDLGTEMVHQAMGMGVRGFVSTTAAPETFKECLRISAHGALWMEKHVSMDLLNARPVSLSKRQSQLMSLLVQGLKNKEIAASLGISEGTVKAYLTTLFEKVGAKDRFELALFGLKNLRNIREAGREIDLRSMVASPQVRRTVA
jgi:DNA-binding NarL/FixJ family response regulator